MSWCCPVGTLTDWMGLRVGDQTGGGLDLGLGIVGGLRFAFYGRTSTTEHQDPVTSRAWQLEVAQELVAGHGTMTATFFDAGRSRRDRWRDRPQAAELLAAVRDRDRGFDAIVMGEYERGLAGDQLERLLALFRRHRVQVWLPEAGGPVDLETPEHRALVRMSGAQSLREVVRARHRVMAAMQALTEEAATWADVLPTVIGWSRRARILTRQAHAAVAASSNWSPTPRPHRRCGGCSPSAWPAAALRPWSRSSTSGGRRARPSTILSATRTAPGVGTRPWMVGRIRTRARLLRATGCGCWRLTRGRREWCGGSSPST
ncbi:resolvase-like protein [Saccharothrix australiensis]|uniref:Resolvase-like protein n=1 Tax=Saccharothrix australiensis TaxID=2072 RepID=A0A495W285_9PSEU|nr:resolvase-like protein [Saccharothrix australiensis]